MTEQEIIKSIVTVRQKRGEALKKAMQTVGMRRCDLIRATKLNPLTVDGAISGDKLSTDSVIVKIVSAIQAAGGDVRKVVKYG